MTNSRREFIKAGVLGGAAVTAGIPLSGQAGEKPTADGPLDILILGGTGFIGSHLVEALQQRSYGEVRCLVRTRLKWLEGLDIVPPEVSAAVREIERRGGAAKLSGAGTLTGAGAGALLVGWPSRLEGDPAEALPGYPCHRAAIGAPGLTIESMA